MDSNDLKVVMDAVAKGIGSITEANAAILMVMLRQLPDPEAVLKEIEEIAAEPELNEDPLAAAFLQRSLSILRIPFADD